MSLTPDQMQELQLAESWFRFNQSLAGKDFDRILRELNDSSIRAIDECDNYQEATGLVIRRQQRAAVIKEITEYVQSQANLRTYLLEQWKEDQESNEYTSTDTES